MVKNDLNRNEDFDNLIENCINLIKNIIKYRKAKKERTQKMALLFIENEIKKIEKISQKLEF